MPNALPPLNAIRVFEVVARRGSFAKAAAELALTQAAVGHQVRLLEARLGKPLFRRTPKGLELTAAGTRLQEAAVPAVAGLRRAVADIREEERRMLVVSAVPNVAHHWLMPRLPRFAEREPGAVLRVEAGIELADLDRGTVDLAVRDGLGRWPGLKARRLADIALAPLASPELLARHGHSDLARLPLMALWKDDWAAWFETARLPCPPDLVVSEWECNHLLAQAALNGLGVALVPDLLHADMLADGRLVRVHDARLATRRAWWLVSPRAGTSALAGRFADWLAAEFVPSRADRIQSGLEAPFPDQTIDGL